ncbi:hypothetical protein, partial [Brachyspira catarrhinii]|uniref:hypothetical protein n=1 Tax=Brachyspira catarrhinii TaxID=2528966 RepID=UPI0013867C7F
TIQYNTLQYNTIQYNTSHNYNFWLFFHCKKSKNLTLIFLFILSLLPIISCKKVNILAPRYIPPETQFKVYTNLFPSELDINTQPAKDGEVFGGFRKKFRYKGEWYILADYKYIYDKANKTLTTNARNVILKIENDEKITIYHENTDSQAWNHLVNNMNVIESDKVIYEPYTYYSKYHYSLGDSVWLPIGFYDLNFHFYNKIVVNDIFYSSENLIRWITNGNSKSFYHKLPDIKANNWQGEWGMLNYKIIMFKNYVYVIGLNENFGEQNPTWKRRADLPPCITSKDKYYRINCKSYDYGVGVGWEEYTTPWGKRSNVELKYDNNKIYIRNGEIFSYANDPTINLWTNNVTNVIDKSVYSTTDGINWNIETDLRAYSNARYDGRVANFPEDKKRTKTPAEPVWIKDNDKNFYYKSANTSLTLNRKTYYLPIPPANEIMEAARRGETNFTITEKHILNGGYNQFMVSDTSPYISEYDWKLIAPLEYTGYSIIWQIGDANMLFNINGKIIQLMDYSKINYFLNSTYSDYLPVINELKSKARTQRQYAERYNNNYYYYQAMYYEAQIDMITEIFNKIEYIKPEEAITHYKIEFKN